MLAFVNLEERGLAISLLRAFKALADEATASAQGLPHVWLEEPRVPRVAPQQWRKDERALLRHR